MSKVGEMVTERDKDKCRVMWLVSSLPSASVSVVAEILGLDVDHALDLLLRLSENGLAAVGSPDGSPVPTAMFRDLAQSTGENWMVAADGRSRYASDLVVTVTGLGFRRALHDCGWVAPEVRESVAAWQEREETER